MEFSTEDIDLAFGRLPKNPDKPETPIANQVAESEGIFRGTLLENSSTAQQELKVEIQQPVWSSSVENTPQENRTNNRKLKLGAAAILAGSLVAGLFYGATRSNNTDEAPNKSGTMVGQSDSQSGNSADGKTPDGENIFEQDTPPVQKPHDYILSFVGFGPKNDGFRELGKYHTKPAEFTFNLNGHEFNIDVPKTQVHLLTGGKHLQTIVNNNGVDEASNTFRKKVLINQNSMDFRAVLPEALDDQMKITTTLPAQKAKASGYENVCEAMPKLAGCPGVPVPDSYKLSAEQVRLYKNAVAIHLLRETQQICAPIEFNVEKKAISYAYDSQAKDLGINPDLISKEYVNSKGEPAKGTPKYTKEIIKSLMVAAGIENARAANKLFSKKPEIKAVCKPMEIKPVA